MRELGQRVKQDNPKVMQFLDNVDKFQFGMANTLTVMAAAFWFVAVMVSRSPDVGLKHTTLEMDDLHENVFRYTHQPPGFFLVAALFMSFLQVIYVAVMVSKSVSSVNDSSIMEPYYKGFKYTPLLLALVYVHEGLSTIFYSNHWLWPAFGVSAASFVVTTLTYLGFADKNRNKSSKIDTSKAAAHKTEFAYADYVCLNLPLKFLLVFVTANVLKLAFAAGKTYDPKMGWEEDNAAAVFTALLVFSTLLINIYYYYDAVYGGVLGLYLIHLASLQDVGVAGEYLSTVFVSGGLVLLIFSAVVGLLALRKFTQRNLNKVFVHSWRTAEERKRKAGSVVV